MSCLRPFASGGRAPLFAAALLAGTLLFSAQGGTAQLLGPFAAYAGEWQGTGRVAGTNGNTERIKCRATYTVSPDGAGLAQTLICASDSFRFDIRSDVVSDGHTIHGTWQETTRDATGNLVGEIKNGVVQSTVSGPGFSARLLVRISGGRQLVSIEPKGTDIAKVDITLTH